MADLLELENAEVFDGDMEDETISKMKVLDYFRIICY